MSTESKQSNLYLVELQGMTFSTSGTVHGVSYVVADNAETAYKLVKTYLDDKSIGYDKDRLLKSITLVASQNSGLSTTTLYIDNNLFINAK